jgi:hypothetical protein
MKFIFLCLISVCYCSAGEPESSVSTLFDNALSYRAESKKLDEEIYSDEWVEKVFGHNSSSIKKTQIEFKSFYELLSNSNAWKITSVTNGFRMMGQAPIGFDYTKLCLRFGISYNDKSEGEDINVAVYLDLENNKFSNKSGNEIFSDLQSGNLQGAVVGYMFIKKGNGWFSDKSKSNPLFSTKK